MSSIAAAPLKVLFFGATGNIGFNVLKRGLLSPKYSARFQVTIGVRGTTLASTAAQKKDKITALTALGAKFIELDLDSAAHSTLVSIIRQHDILVSITSHGTPLEKSLALVEAVKEAGNLKLFVPSEFGFIYDALQLPSPVRDADGKVKLGAALAASGVPFARIVTGAYHEYFFGPFGGYDMAKRATTMPGGAASRVTLMGEEDGAQLTAEVLLNHSAAYVRNQTVLLGTDTISWGALAALLEEKTKSSWTKTETTAAELEAFVAANPTTSYLQRWHLLMARQRGAYWDVNAENTFVQQHQKAHPDFKPKLQSVKEYIQQLKL